MRNRNSVQMATSKQIGYIKGLCKQRDFDFETSELEKLSNRQANKMIRDLLGEPIVKPEDKMKNKIISMAKTIGWVKDNSIDISRLNNWCLNKGMYQQALDDHNIDQLPHLVSQFQYGPFSHALKKEGVSNA